MNTINKTDRTDRTDRTNKTDTDYLTAEEKIFEHYYLDIEHYYLDKVSSTEDSVVWRKTTDPEKILFTPFSELLVIETPALIDTLPYSQKQKAIDAFKNDLEEIFIQKYSYTSTPEETEFPGLYAPRVKLNWSRYEIKPDYFRFFLVPKRKIKTQTILPHNYYFDKKAFKDLCAYIKKIGTLHIDLFCDLGFSGNFNTATEKECAGLIWALHSERKSYNEEGIYIRPKKSVLEYNPKMAARQTKTLKASIKRRQKKQKEYRENHIYMHNAKNLLWLAESLIEKAMPTPGNHFSGYYDDMPSVLTRAMVLLEITDGLYNGKAYRHFEAFQTLKDIYKNADNKNKLSADVIDFMDKEIKDAPGRPRKLYERWFGVEGAQFLKSRLKKQFKYVKKISFKNIK